MQKPFSPEPKPGRYRGALVYLVDCRQWSAQMRTLGYPLRRRFSTRDEAQAWCRQLVVEATVGRKLDTGPAVLQSLCELYQRSVAAGSAPETVRLYRSQKRKFLQFAQLHQINDVRDVTAAAVDMYRADLYAEGLAANTIIGYLSWVGKLYRWANRLGYVSGNPAATVKMPKRENKRRNFTDAELETLMVGADPELAPLWTLLLLTGMRRNEVANLQCDDVELETPAPFVRVIGKGNKPRVIPLVSKAQEAVRYFLARATGGKLVPYGYYQLYELWISERDRLKLADDLVLHSFRHTFISWLANRTGTPLTEVQAVAGHSSVVTTQVYVHRDEAQLRIGMQRMEADMAFSRHQQKPAAKESVVSSDVSAGKA